MLRHLLIALVLAVLYLPVAARADQVNIAQAIGVPSFTLTPYDLASPYGATCPIGATSPCETFTASSEVTFQFDLVDPYNPAFQSGQNITAQLNWSAVSTSPSIDLGGGMFMETGFSGDFEITKGTANLLSGTFTNASLLINGLTAGLTTGTVSNIVFDSDYLMFANNTTFALSLGTTLAHLDTQDAYHFLNFDSSWGTATFSSSPPPEYGPEPATLSLGGSALLGMFLLRKRRHKPVR